VRKSVLLIASKTRDVKPHNVMIDHEKRKVSGLYQLVVVGSHGTNIMHDTLAVAEVQRLKQLENVEANIVIGKAGVQCAEAPQCHD
jgi:hypothetical protein